MLKTFYHYTTKSSLDNILKSKLFNPSYLDVTLDSTFGEGHYFTDLNPKVSDEILSKTLWQRNDTSKINAFIAFEIDDSLMQKCSGRHHVFRLPIGTIIEHSINLSIQYKFADTQKLAIKYKNCAYRTRRKNVTNESSNWKFFGSIALIGIVGIAIAKIIK